MGSSEWSFLNDERCFMSLRRYNMEVFIVNSIVSLELSNEFWQLNKIKDSIVFVSYKLIKGSERGEILKIK